MPDFENDPTITHLLKSVGLDLRRQELLATLSEADVQRVTRFGEKRSYRDGQLMFEGNEEVSLRVFHAQGWQFNIVGYSAELTAEDAQATALMANLRRTSEGYALLAYLESSPIRYHLFGGSNLSDAATRETAYGMFGDNGDGTGLLGVADEFRGGIDADVRVDTFAAQSDGFSATATMGHELIHAALFDYVMTSTPLPEPFGSLGGAITTSRTSASLRYRERSSLTSESGTFFTRDSRTGRAMTLPPTLR